MRLHLFCQSYDNAVQLYIFSKAVMLTHMTDENVGIFKEEDVVSLWDGCDENMSCLRLLHHHVLAHTIGVNITAFGRKLTLFRAIPLSRFSLKMSRLFQVGKMPSVRSVQRQVELRRLDNQLPVLGKANSLCKIVILCVLPVLT